jgi:hypothetical protein
VISPLRGTLVALLGCVAAGCGHRAASPPASAEAPPIILDFDHLQHLTRDATVGTRRVSMVALYANAPDYRPTGSPLRDGLEGIASVDDAARAAVLYLRDYQGTGDARPRDAARGLLQFIAAMEQGDGEFLNFVDSAGKPNATAPSGRRSMSFWAARSIWALGEAHLAFGHHTPRDCKASARHSIAPSLAWRGTSTLGD